MEAEGKTAERCEINRDIREHNLVLKQLKETAQEITKLVKEKVRELFDRFIKFGADSVDYGFSGENDGYSGKAAE